MKKIFYTILLLGIIICSVSIEAENILTNTNNYITYNLGKRPSNLLMTDNLQIREKDLIVALFQGLVTEDFSGEITKGLAESYKVSEDGLEYTFQIRQSAKYSNGEKITAKDFVDFFKNFLEDKNNVYAEQLNCVFGAQDFRNKKVGFQDVAISAKDNNVLSIRLNYKCPYFIKILSQPVYALRDYKTLKGNFDETYSHAKYTGPFIIDKIDENKDVILVKNLNYYNNSEVTKEKIRFKFMEDEEKALAKFEMEDNKNDNIDIMINSPINEYLRLTNEKKVRSFPSNSVYYLNFNVESKNIIGDINFRNALNSILSKEYYAQQISDKFAVAASLYVPEGSLEKRLFDTFGNKNKSIEYLKKTNITGTEKLILVYEENSFNKRIAEDLTRNIIEDIGIAISCRGYNEEELKKVLETKQYDLYINKFTPIFNDLSLYYDLWNSASKQNKIGYNNPKYDKLIKEAKSEDNEEKRNLIYRQCEDILKADLPSVPIYYLNTMICIKPNITGVYTTNLGNIKLEYMSIN